jgi:hypothetical protein
MGEKAMGMRWNMTSVEYKLHEAYWRGVFKKLFTNPALHPLWWKLVVSWCNVIELRYGNFQREWFLESLQERCGTNFKDPGLEPGVLPES